MGKRSEFKRIERDFYPTPRAAVEPLVPFLPSGEFTFVEPCAGDGRLADHLLDLCPDAHCVAAYDIEPTADWVEPHDATKLTEAGLVGADLIITNPPWDRTKSSGYLLHRLIEHFANLAPTWLLFDSDWVHTKQAVRLIEEYLVQIVAIGRVKWIEDSKMTGKDNVCWHLFSYGARAITERPQFFPRGVVPAEAILPRRSEWQWAA